MKPLRRTLILLPGLCLGLVFAATALLAQNAAKPAAGGQATAAQHTKYRTKFMVYDVATRKTKVIYTANGQFHAPNYTMDGKYIISDMGGDLYRIPVNGDTAGPAERIVMSQKMAATNDHALSYDGKRIAVTGFAGPMPARSGNAPVSPAGFRKYSKLFVMNMDGSDARQVQTGWEHGWTRDNQRVLYVTTNKADYDIFSGDMNGGDEKQLTTNPAQDDGPESSPDGKWIYFCSNRSGKWDGWRMPTDGAGPDDKMAQRVTFGADTQDWFPHVSPDGKWLYTMSYPMDHPDHQYVGADMKIKLLRLQNGMAAKGAELKTIAAFFGGQGSGNTGGWAPDSKRFAWTVYEEIPAAK